MSIRISKLSDGRTYFMEIGPQTILFGCGLNIGTGSAMDMITALEEFGKPIDCVLIPEPKLHLCGGLPLLIRRGRYTGPVVMSHATKALAPLLVCEYMLHRVATTKEKKNRSEAESFENYYSPSKAEASQRNADVFECFQLASEAAYGQPCLLTPRLSITLFPSGQSPGGTAFLIESAAGMKAMFVDGFGFHQVPSLITFGRSLEVDVLAIASSFPVTVSETRAVIHREFLHKVRQCVERGGKVLIPVYGIGSYQEILPLLKQYWTRMKLDIPIYSSGIAELDRSLVAFIDDVPLSMTEFDPALLQTDKPFVIFSSPGLIDQGLTFTTFTSIAANPKNLVVLSDYCTPGTLNYDLLTGAHKPKILKSIEGETIQCAIHYIPCGEDGDCRSIIKLAKMLKPKHVALLQDSAKDPVTLARKVLTAEMKMSCYDLLSSRDGSITVPIERQIPVSAADYQLEQINKCMNRTDKGFPKTRFDMSGILLNYSDNTICLVSPEHCSSLVNLPQHEMVYAYSTRQRGSHRPNKRRKNSVALSFLLADAAEMVTQEDETEEQEVPEEPVSWGNEAFEEIWKQVTTYFPYEKIVRDGLKFQTRSFNLEFLHEGGLSATWSMTDDNVAHRIIGIGNRVLKEFRDRHSPSKSAPRKKVALW